MLTELAIRDFAIVDHLELDLAGGMTAITGETGAGKSILLGALGLCLGERADSASATIGFNPRFTIQPLNAEEITNAKPTKQEASDDLPF